MRIVWPRIFCASSHLFRYGQPILPMMRPEAGTLPLDFHPIAVITCTEATTEDNAVNGVATVAEEHWTGDLSAVLMAFAQPSRPQTWFSNYTASAARLPAVWLVDAAGRAVRPAYPTKQSAACPATPRFAGWNRRKRCSTSCLPARRRSRTIAAADSPGAGSAGCR